MFIEGARVTLRPWQVGDIAALARIANNRRIWRNMTDRFPHPYTEDDARGWIEFANSRPEDARHSAILCGGELVGGGGFARGEDLHTRTAEIGYWLGEAHWGRGLASEALALMTTCAWREFDFVRLQAHVLAWNPASCRVLEKAGYSREARLARLVWKDGEVCDAILYAMLRGEAPG